VVYEIVEAGRSEVVVWQDLNTCTKTLCLRRCVVKELLYTERTCVDVCEVHEDKYAYEMIDIDG
jgi:hypothetical protein